jgi:hypothetical protein
MMPEENKQTEKQEQKQRMKKGQRASAQQGSTSYGVTPRSSTDPESVKDEGYIRRIEEKTKKH